VYRAYEPDRDRLVAVKLFRLDLPPERVHKLVAELEQVIGAELTHGAIAAPLASGIDNVSPYLAQDYVAADSLDVVVRDNGAAQATDAVRLLVQLAGALDFAAAAGITHGALHPRDVLISTEDTRITGLGIAAALERVGVAPPLRRPYTAPERMSGGSWDRRADIFSLAALMHEVLCGRRIAGIGGAVADRLGDVDGADESKLGEAFARALAEKPADRFATALEFAAALREAFPALVDRSTIASGRSEEPSPRAPARAEPPAKGPERPVEPPRLPLEPAAPEVRAAEASRYSDVESAPAVVPGINADDEPPIRPYDREPPSTPPPPGLLVGHDTSVLERSRSAVWPLALALMVGVAIGFGAGYAVGNRERASGTVASSSAPTATAGREFTEGAVTEPPRVAPASLPPTTPAARSAANAPTSTAVEPGVDPSAARSAPGRSINNDGRLMVRSTPAGARVFVDGRDRGSTPAAIRDLARGAHRVRVVQEGYATEERRVTLNAARPAQTLSVTLAPTRAPAARTANGSFHGALSVESRPAGAKVFVDGRLVGTTPMVLSEVTAGSHVIRLDHDGYRRWSSAVRVVAGERNRVTASLER